MDRILYSPSARPTVIFTAHIDPYIILYNTLTATTVHVLFFLQKKGAKHLSRELKLMEFNIREFI